MMTLEREEDDLRRTECGDRSSAHTRPEVPRQSPANCTNGATARPLRDHVHKAWVDG